MVLPKKAADAPAPLYALHPTSYCRTCGRVNSSKKQKSPDAGQVDPPKFCSTRCKHNKPTEWDRTIESTFVALLDGDESTAMLQDSGALERLPATIVRTGQTRRKGDPRVLVRCSDVREVVCEGQESAIVTTEEQGVEIADHAGYNTNTPTNKTKQHKGMRLAEEKERVKRAARRLVVFGYRNSPGELSKSGSVDVGGSESASLRYCEAISNGEVVEPSFAKGDWGIRWRQG